MQTGVKSEAEQRVLEERPSDPSSKMMRGSAGLGEGTGKMSASEAAEKLRSTFGSQQPPALSNTGPRFIESGGFFTSSGHFTMNQTSPTIPPKLNRKLSRIPDYKKIGESDGSERVQRAMELVDQFNRLSRQKRGGFYDSENLPSTGTCHFCELECLCFGPSCLRKKGIIIKILESIILK